MIINYDANLLKNLLLCKKTHIFVTSTLKIEKYQYYFLINN